MATRLALWPIIRVVFATAILTIARPLAAGAEITVLTTADDAQIVADPDARTWTLHNSVISFMVGFDRSSDFHALSLTNPKTGRAWPLLATSDSLLTVDSRRLAIGSRGDGFSFISAEAVNSGSGVQLAVVFELSRDHLQVTRYYRCYPASPVIETWTTVTALEADLTTAFSDLNSWELTVGGGVIQWLTGLNMGSADGVQFSVQSRQLGPGERLDLGARGRSSETAVPLFIIDNGSDQFVGGILWSGAWALSMEADEGSLLRVAMGLPGMTTTWLQNQPLETPHGFFGFEPRLGGGAARGLRMFAERGLRSGRPFEALVTYNTWFVYGTRFDDQDMFDEMDHASTLGAELFVVDAGWYAGGTEYFDFTTGLGSWRADPARFPDGLRPLTEHAHEQGMKFGLWVEPERVALETVGREGLANESWLAKTDGLYDPSVEAGKATSAQICLAHAPARQWVLDRLVQIIDEARPDYLKWDNNFWINCNRAGHAHGASDGNFAHVGALYGLLAEIRRRYPNLIIENVSGGGNRMDFGMLQYTDSAWMDDRTTPSDRVRHNLEGLSRFFPPAYLLSFVMEHPNEPIHNAPDLELYFRSRMPGVMGLAFRGASLTQGETIEAAREIGLYKELRRLLVEGSTTLLTTPVDPDNVPPWDVMEIVASSGAIVLYAFQNDPTVPALLVKLAGVNAELAYDVRSVDRGSLGAADGLTLTLDGLAITSSPDDSKAHILVLTPKGPAGTSQR